MAIMRHISEFIKKQNTLTLATEKNHDVFAAALFYVPIKNSKSLLFVSKPNSEHMKNLELNRKCAASIQENNLDWRKIRGVQLKGTVNKAEQKHWKDYLDKFNYISKSDVLTNAMKKVVLYELKINWIRFIDNSEKFGNKLEMKYN